MRRALAGLAAAVLLVAGCNGGNGGGNGQATGSPTGSPSPSPTATETNGGGNQAARIGSIKSTVPEVFLSDDEAFDDDLLRVGDVLVTGPSGAAVFSLDGQVEQCNQFPRSRVVMQPSRGVLFAVEASPPERPLVCATRGDGSLRQFVAGDALLETRDPVFSVIVWEGETTLKVGQGFMRLRLQDAGPADWVLVGPNLQMTAGQQVAPTAPRATIYRDQRERSDLQALESVIPKPSRGRPPAGGSATLGRVYTNAQLQLGFDDDALNDQPQQARDRTEQFLFSFGDTLQTNWDLDVKTDRLSGAEADEAGAAGELDVFITPNPPEGSATLPFLRDDDGRIWSIFAPGDEQFAKAFRRWLVAWLEVGEYGTAFSRAFDRVPPYEIFEDLVT